MYLYSPLYYPTAVLGCGIISWLSLATSQAQYIVFKAVHSTSCILFVYKTSRICVCLLFFNFTLELLIKVLFSSFQPDLFAILPSSGSSGWFNLRWMTHPVLSVWNFCWLSPSLLDFMNNVTFLCNHFSEPNWIYLAEGFTSHYSSLTLERGGCIM